EKVVGKSGQIGGQKKWSELTKKQAAVFEIIRANPEVSRGKLARSLDINPSAVQKHIEKLKQRGFISRVGPDKGGHWKT
ncbi:MAG: winged helix-turn-helix transcriptional regulator, partial [Elusimicrobiota bacterium]